MSLASNNNISKIKLGRISEHTIGLIRLLHKLVGVKFKITEKEIDDYDQDFDENEYMGEEAEDDEGDDYKEEKEKTPMPK
jgi:hypothetical protein